MRILRIQFHHLNSLPCGDIDLEQGPLAQAGIFAITGPTGAGKSTILDAITLALYGRASRYGKNPNPAEMMSRHAGECGAEVLFEVPKGRFVARWDLRRARNKPTGNLQPATRKVMDAAGTVLAEKLGEADRLIEELTGLDCDRFLRSVLLAQGEFAQFLKATPNDRAALLESLTGTQIYSELSIRAHEEFAKREQGLLRHEEALGQLILLSPEEREAKSAEIERLSAELARLEAEREALAQRIGQGRQFAALRVREAEVAEQQSRLAEARQTAAPELDRLARFRLAQPFLPYLQTLDALTARMDEETRGVEAAQRDSKTAQQHLAAGKKAALQFGQRWVAAAEAALKNAQDLQNQRAAELKSLDEWLAAHAADQALDGALAGLVDRLAALSARRGLLAQTQASGTALSSERAQAAARLTALQEQRAEAVERERKARNALTLAEETLRGLLKGRTLEMIQKDLNKLDQKRTLLAELRVVMEKRDAIDLQGQTLSVTEARLEPEIQEGLVQKAAAEREAETQAALLKGAREHLALLERIASFEDQRTQLKADENCPLCGALEHPFADPSAQPSAAIEDARRNLNLAEMASATATREAQLATAEWIRCQEELKLVQKSRGELRLRQMQAYEALETQGRTLRIFTTEALEEAEAANQSARSNTETLLTAAREAETARNETELAHVRQKSETERLQETLTGEQNALNRLDEQLAANAEALAKFQSEAASLGDELTTALAPFGLNTPEAGCEAQTRETLETRRQAYQCKMAEKNRLTSEWQQLGIRLEALERQAAEARTQAEQLAETRPADGWIADETSETEAALTGKAWQTPQEAASALETLRAALMEIHTSLEERLKSRNSVREAAERQANELRQRLAGSPFADAETLRAARLPEADEARIDLLGRKLEAEVQTLAGQLAQVRAQAEAFKAAPQGEMLAALEAEQKPLETLRTERLENRTTLRNQLDQDQQNRAAQAAQVQALELERSRLVAWKQLRELIGSHDGKKFSRFAQGLSLDVLIRHANRHLHRLSDRYQLRRESSEELALEIIDLHQASVSRSMQSLSGGESFLASLALALGLSDLAGRNVRIDSLFIDEGFGSLDAEALDLAVAALDTLRLSNKTVGVISHVELLKERIPVQIRVEKLAGGQSRLRLPE